MITGKDIALTMRNLSTKVCLVKAVVFPVVPVVMYGCESWTTKLIAKELILLNCGVGKDS